MNWDSYFTDGDKPYSEHLNDSLVLTDAFDISVPVEMPTMFSNGEFNSALNVTRKCNVGLVTLKSVDNGVTIGTDSISGTGSVVFRVYPNFNCFYKWDKILLEKSGTVDISFRKPDGSGITATVGSDGTISDSSALKQLQEIDVVFTLSSATINNILIWFVNNQGTRNRTGARLEASQLVNVNGTVTANDDKAVNGGTVKNAFDSFETDVVDEKLADLSDEMDGKLSEKEDVSNKVTTLDNNSSHYPSCSAVKTVTDAKENTSNKVNSLDSNSFSNTLYPSTNALKLALDLIKDMVTCDITAEWQTIGNQNFAFKCIFDVNLINLKYEIKVKDGTGDSYTLISSGTITSNQETVNTNIIGHGISPECLVRIIFPYTLEEVKSQTFTRQ